MCDSCTGDHSSRWATSRLVFLTVVVALVGLSAVGATARLTAGGHPGQACREATIAAIEFQAAVTRERLDHSRLHAHTRAFGKKLVELGATRCPETVRFVKATRPTLAGLCADCMVALADAHRSPV